MIAATYHLSARYRGSLLFLLLLPACATHELALSSALRPALSSAQIGFPIEHFRARVGQAGDLEVRVRVDRGMGDYRRNFDSEIHSATALCVALANFDRTFSTEWSKLELHVTNEYGSQLQWQTAHTFTKVTMSRETLLELRKRNAPASAYPLHWQLVASKVGPPDYVYYEYVMKEQRF